MQTQRILKGGEGGEKHIFVLDFFGFFLLFTPPLKKITYAKKILRNYFRGDCDSFA